MKNKDMITRFTFEKVLDLVDFSCMVLHLVNKGYMVSEYESSQAEGYMQVYFYKEEDGIFTNIELYNDSITIRRLSARDSLELYEELLKCTKNE